MNITHDEARRRHLQCTCGYQATDANDLREHIDAMRDDQT